MRFHMLTMCSLALAGLCHAQTPPLPNPDDPVDYAKWFEQTCCNVPKEQNAWLLYQAAADALVDTKVHPDLLLRKPVSEWASTDRMSVTQWFHENHKALQIFEQATLRPQCARVPDGLLPIVDNGKGMPQPLIQGALRFFGKMYCVRAHARLQTGEVANAVEDLATALRLARHLMTQPDTVFRLIGTALYDLVVQELQSLPFDTLSFAKQRQIIAIVSACDSGFPEASHAMLYERVTILQSLQRGLRDTDGDGLFDVYANALLGRDVRLAKPVSMRQACVDIDALLARCEAVHNTPRYADAQKLVDEIQREIGSKELETLVFTGGTANSAERMQALAAKMPPGAELLMPPGDTLATCRLRQVRRRAMQITLRLYAFKAEHDRWPRDLAEAMKGTDPNLCKDPFTGAELIYRVQDGQLLLYSCGYDGDDDGGRFEAEHFEVDGDIVLWPR